MERCYIIILLNVVDYVNRHYIYLRFGKCEWDDAPPLRFGFGDSSSGVGVSYSPVSSVSNSANREFYYRLVGLVSK